MSVGRSAFAQSVLKAQESLSPKLAQQMLFFPPEIQRQASQIVTPTTVHPEQHNSLGHHWLADFKISDEVKQNLLDGNPEEKIAKIVWDAATVAEATLLGQVSHQAKSGNIASVVVIEESHLSMHFIPEENSVFVDVFTCGVIKFATAIEYISQQLQCKPVAFFEGHRGIQVEQNFISGIGIKEKENLQMLKSGRNNHDVQALARHVIMELYLCPFDIIDNLEGIQDTFAKAFMIAGGKLQGKFDHKFQPQGVSQVSIGSGVQLHLGGHCHLTIHTYPEHGYAALDVFDATGQMNMDRMIHHLQASFGSAKISTHEFLRGAYQLDLDNKKEFIDGLRLAQVPFVAPVKPVEIDVIHKRRLSR